MAVEFEFAPVPMPSGRPKKLRYYPRVVNRRTVSTPDIVKEIEMACTLTRTDVVAVLDALNRSLVGWLKDGWRVHIDGIGYFDVSLTAPETRNPKDTRASSVKFKNVNFRADKELRYRVAELKAERSKAGSHSAHLSEIEIDMKLTEFLVRTVYWSVAISKNLPNDTCYRRTLFEAVAGREEIEEYQYQAATGIRSRTRTLPDFIGTVVSFTLNLFTTAGYSENGESDEGR